MADLTKTFGLDVRRALSDVSSVRSAIAQGFKATLTVDTGQLQQVTRLNGTTIGIGVDLNLANFDAFEARLSGLATDLEINPTIGPGLDDFEAQLSLLDTNLEINPDIGSGLDDLESQLSLVDTDLEINPIIGSGLDDLESQIAAIPTDIELDIFLNGDAELDDLANSLSALDGSSIEIDLNISGTADLDAIASQVSALRGGIIDLQLNVNGREQLDGLSDDIAASATASTGLGAALGGLNLNPVAVGVAAVATGLGAAVNEAQQFETGIREVASLQIPNFGIDEATALMEDFNAETQLGLTDNIPALYQALSAGVPPENALDFLITSSQLASAGVAELGPTVGVLSSAVNAYGDNLGPVEDASNALFATVQSGVTTLPELANSLGQVTPLAAAMGVSFTELNAAVATSTQVTGNTAQSVTGLRGVLAELGTSTSKAGLAFQEASGVTFPAFIEQGGSLQEGLQLMNDSADDLGLGLNELFGSVEAGGVALQLTRDDGQAFADTMDNVSSIVAEGAAVQEAFNINQAGFAASLGRLQSQVQAVAIDLGNRFLPVLTTAVDLVSTGLVPAFDLLVTAAGGVQDFFLGVAGAIIGVSDPIAELQGGLRALVFAFQTPNDFTSGGLAGFLEGFGVLAGSVFQVVRDDVIPAVGEIIDAFRTDPGAEGGGLFDFLTEVGRGMAELGFFIQDNAGPAIERFSGFIVSDVVPAVQAFAGFVVDDLLPAIGDFAGFVATEVVPVLVELGGDIFGTLLRIGGQVADFVVNDLVPGFSRIATVVRDEFGPVFTENLLPALQDFADFAQADLLPAIESFAGVLLDDVLPAAIDFGAWAAEEAVPVLADLAAIVIDEVVPAISDMVDFLGDVVSLGVDVVTTVADIVGELIDVSTAIADFAGKTFEFGISLVETPIDLLLDISGWISDWLNPSGGKAYDFTISLIDNAIDLLLDISGWVTNWLGGEDGGKGYDFSIDLIDNAIDLLLDISGWVTTWLGGESGGKAYDFSIDLIDGVIGPVKDISDWLTTWVGGVNGGKLYDFALSIDVGSVFTALDSVASAIGDIRDTIGGLASSVPGASSLFGGITGAIGNIRNQISNLGSSVPNLNGGTSAAVTFLADGAVLDSATLNVAGEAGTEIVAPVERSMARTVDLFDQSGYLNQLVDELISRGEFDRMVAQPQFTGQPATAAAAPEIVLAQAAPVINVAPPQEMNNLAWSREAVRQMQVAQERAAAQAQAAARKQKRKRMAHA